MVTIAHDYRAGELAKIVKYCKRDVGSVRAVTSGYLRKIALAHHVNLSKGPRSGVGASGARPSDKTIVFNTETTERWQNNYLCLLEDLCREIFLPFQDKIPHIRSG